ncbi:MAG TPA: hypothetical protein VFT95_07315 [Micromonosporaceae bacterium]|nr:hypothetical protein [Micromonosporaceae bacterium]
MTRPRRPCRPRGDRGASLVELTVVLALMGVFTAMFTTSVVQVYRTTNRTDALATAQADLHIAFAGLDAQVRYASWVRQPAENTRYRYVEFLGRHPTTELPRCVRLVLDKSTGQLYGTDWPVGGSPGDRRRLASNVVTDSTTTFEVQQPGTQPFASASPVPPGADYAPDFQRLRIRLRTLVGTSGTAATDVTFSAVNTSRTTVPGPECTEGRPTP